MDSVSVLVNYTKLASMNLHAAQTSLFDPFSQNIKFVAFAPFWPLKVHMPSCVEHEVRHLDELLHLPFGLDTLSKQPLPILFAVSAPIHLMPLAPRGALQRTKEVDF